MKQIYLLLFLSLTVFGMAQKDTLKIVKTTNEMTGIIHYEANKLIVCTDSSELETITTSFLIGKNPDGKKGKKEHKGLDVSGMFVHTNGFFPGQSSTLFLLLTNGERIILSSIYTKRESALFSINKDQLSKLKSMPVKRIMFETSDQKRLYRIYGTLSSNQQGYYIDLNQLAENWTE